MKPFKNTIILAIFICIFTLSKHAGFMVVLFLIPYAIYFIISIYNLIYKKNKKFIIIKNLIFITTFLIIFSNHYYLHYSTRNAQDKIAKTIEDYYLKNGEYPKSIQEVKNLNPSYKERRIYYSITNNQPFLMYPATWIPFDTYHYDFKTKQWEFAPS